MKTIIGTLKDWGIPILGGFLVIFFASNILKYISIELISVFLQVNPTKNLNTTTLGQIGDTMGGTTAPAIGLIVGYLTFLAFWVQFRANINQRQDIQIERFNNRFYEMIKLHRDNVSEMNFTSSKTTLGIERKDDKVKERTAKSRKVFKVIYSDFERLYLELDIFFKDKAAEDIYKCSYLEQIRLNTDIADRNINLVSYARLDIVYCIIFIGLSKDGKRSLSEFFKKRYNEIFFAGLLNYAALKPKQESINWWKWTVFNDLESALKKQIADRWISDLLGKNGAPSWLGDVDPHKNQTYKNVYYLDNYEKYYGGHQFRLGHYFRHFYNSISYINNSKLLTYAEKYESAKLLRSQLSTYEQIIVFLNSVSSFGRIWELEKAESPGKPIDLNLQLITKYNLIKNFSTELLVTDILVSNYYPLVAYELNFSEDLRKKREKLRKKYI